MYRCDEVSTWASIDRAETDLVLDHPRRRLLRFRRKRKFFSVVSLVPLLPLLLGQVHPAHELFRLSSGQTFKQGRRKIDRLNGLAHANK